MEALKEINKKVKTGNINIAITKDKVTFSYEFEGKQEKELNIAAGKVHRRLVDDAWEIEGDTLSVAYSIAEINARKIAFSEISELFEQMVK